MFLDFDFTDALFPPRQFQRAQLMTFEPVHRVSPREITVDYYDQMKHYDVMPSKKKQKQNKSLCSISVRRAKGEDNSKTADVVGRCWK